MKNVFEHLQKLSWEAFQKLKDLGCFRLAAAAFGCNVVFRYFLLIDKYYNIL